MHLVAMEGNNAHDEIERLEAVIEAEADRLESCRKYMLAARVAIALGAAMLLWLVLGNPRPASAALVAGIAAMLGGIVLLGSNRSTAQEASAARATAEARRAELISQMDLRVIED